MAATIHSYSLIGEDPAGTVIVFGGCHGVPAIAFLHSLLCLDDPPGFRVPRCLNGKGTDMPLFVCAQGILYAFAPRQLSRIDEL
ncbi:hypothetical protein MTO96_018260 [Rhipicephalus appendiculatus]